MSRQSSGILEFVAGFMLGGLIGATVGLLLAPQSGEETRAQLSERGIELRDQLQKRAGELSERVPTIVEEQRTRVQQAIERGKEAATKKRDEILGRAQAAQQTEAES